MILEEYYNKNKGYTIVVFSCPSCNTPKHIRKQAYLKRTYSYCFDCYQKSPERKLVAAKTVKNRPPIVGKNNPNYKGRVEKICKCGKEFNVNKSRENTAKYCSYECAATYRPHAIKKWFYKDIWFRSSWEMKFARYLDNLKIEWNYESKTFDTSFGHYTPDFWIPNWNSFVEVKGWFRDDAKEKFEEVSKNYPIILADKKYLRNLGIKIR